MKTAEQLAQWVIDNRYPKSENNKVSDSEMYHELVESIAKLCTIPDVSESLPIEDAKFIYSLLPDWVKNKAPEELYPTMYGTLSKEGDDEIQERVKQILGNVY